MDPVNPVDSQQAFIRFKSYLKVHTICFVCRTQPVSHMLKGTQSNHRREGSTEGIAAKLTTQEVSWRSSNGPHCTSLRSGGVGLTGHLWSLVGAGLLHCWRATAACGKACTLHCKLAPTIWPLSCISQTLCSLWGQALSCN